MTTWLIKIILIICVFGKCESSTWYNNVSHIWNTKVSTTIQFHKIYLKTMQKASTDITICRLVTLDNLINN